MPFRLQRLEAQGFGPDEVASPEGTFERLDAAGLELVEMVLGPPETWDRYEAAQWLAVTDWLPANPDDPDHHAMIEFRDHVRRTHLRWGRRCLGRVRDAPEVGEAKRGPARRKLNLGRCATVCYMSEHERPARVGVRELRQNLSVYLDRVKAGETLEVTEHGVPVARLGPRPAQRLSIIEQMIADGRITPSTTDHRTLPPPPRLPGRPLSEILQEMRDEDDR